MTSGTITINFINPESSLSLLWGSIDPENTLTFLNGNSPVLTVTGVQTQAAANTISDGLGNGFLGPGGSAYFVIDTATPFTSVTATNIGMTADFPSFEFTGVAAAAQPPFTTPEPANFWTLTIGLGMIGFGIVLALVRRRRHGTSRAASFG